MLTSTRLTINKVIRSEKHTHRRLTHRVHGAGLQVDEYCPRHIFAIISLVVVNVDAFQLQVIFAVVHSIRINAVFVGYYLPELQDNDKFKNIT